MTSYFDQLKTLPRLPGWRWSNYPRGNRRKTWFYNLEEGQTQFSTKKEALNWRKEVIAAGPK